MNTTVTTFAQLATRFAVENNPEQDAYGNPSDPTRFQQVRDAKFAELLINEARLVLNKAAFDLGNTPESRAVLQASINVKHHFEGKV